MNRGIVNLVGRNFGALLRVKSEFGAFKLVKSNMYSETVLIDFVGFQCEVSICLECDVIEFEQGFTYSGL